MAQKLQSELLSEREAAHYLCLSQITLRRWRCCGKGPAFVRVSSRAIRYSLEDLRGFIESRRVRRGGAVI